MEIIFFSNRQKQQIKDRLFAIVLFLSVINIVSEASVEASMKTVKVDEMGIVEITAYVFYLFSMVLILLLIIDYLLMNIFEKIPVPVWMVIQVPAVVVIVIAFVLPFRGTATQVMQVSSIIYLLVIIVLYIRGHRDMEPRMKKGLGWFIGMFIFTYSFDHIFVDMAMAKAINVTIMDLALFYTLQNPDADLIKELDVQKKRAEAATQAKSAPY